MTTDTSLASIYKHRAVSDRLATSGQPTVAQLASIAAAGFQTVINLALHDDPRYSLPDEPGTVRALGMHYVHIPVQFKAPTRADLLAFFDAMDAHRGERVWVHCAANMRVSAFLGLYRVLRQGTDREAAFDLMRELWQPDAVWASFIDQALAAPSRTEGTGSASTKAASR
ncbi:MAG TPA: protein tyrosine phosphatase family protein [Rhizobacter sp.]|nr:protein tyrosine phosphatase family protein [Rhizobacter sp.]